MCVCVCVCVCVCIHIYIYTHTHTHTHTHMIIIDAAATRPLYLYICFHIALYFPVVIQGTSLWAAHWKFISMPSRYQLHSAPYWICMFLRLTTIIVDWMYLYPSLHHTASATNTRLQHLSHITVYSACHIQQSTTSVTYNSLQHLSHTTVYSMSHTTVHSGCYVQQSVAFAIYNYYLSPHIGCWHICLHQCSKWWKCYELL